jgi:hypothetical protein
MVKEKIIDLFLKRKSINVKVKKHVSESEPVAYGFYCFGVASEYIDIRNVLCGQDQSKYTSSGNAINSSVFDLGFQKKNLVIL